MFPDFGNAKNSRSVYRYHCKVKMLLGLPKLTGLQNLYLYRVAFIDIPNLNYWTNWKQANAVSSRLLHTLNLSWYSQLKSFPGLREHTNLTSLRHLCLSNCRKLRDCCRPEQAQGLGITWLYRLQDTKVVLGCAGAHKLGFAGLEQMHSILWVMGAAHMGESSPRREPGVEPDGARRLAVRTVVGPTCGGERRTQANPATPGLGRRSASPPPPAKVCSGRMRLIPPRHSALRKDLMCPAPWPWEPPGAQLLQVRWHKLTLLNVSNTYTWESIGSIPRQLTHLYMRCCPVVTKLPNLGLSQIL